LQIPLDPKVKYITDLPYTLSFTIRKRTQIDSLNELGKEKRPPDSIIWDGTSSDLDSWLEKVLSPSSRESNGKDVVIEIDNIEG
jgi:hypothetical protein